MWIVCIFVFVTVGAMSSGGFGTNHYQNTTSKCGKYILIGGKLREV